MGSSRRLERALLFAYASAVAIVALVLLAVPIRAFAADINLPVPNTVVYPGQTVLDHGVTDKPYRVPAKVLQDYVVEEAMLDGKVARRTLLPGKPILLSDLKAPDVVRAGVTATMVYRAGGLLITTIGTPLRSASEGESVRVRNNDSGLIVSGVVAADGSIEVGDR